MGAPDGLLKPPVAAGHAPPADVAGDVGRIVGATIDGYGMLTPGSRVLAALSGGRDSTALVLLLRALGYDVVAGHVDHAMRPGSGEDAAHCRSLAAAIGVPFLSERLPVPPADEAAARRARYEALERMRREAGAGRIATGHTRDDAAETVAMRLGRGGAAMGIPPLRGRVVRPLIAISRRDTEAVCRWAGVAWVDDPTNEDERHRRNRLRRRAMPALGDAAAGLAAVGTANAVRSQEERARAEDLAGHLVTARGARAEIDRAALRSLPPADARAVIRLTLERLGIPAGERVVADVAAKVLPVTGAGLDLGSGMRAWSDSTRVVVAAPRDPVLLPAVALATPGETISAAWGVSVVVEEVPTADGPPPEGVLEARLDRSAAAAGLVLRQRRPGDRLAVAGGRGTTKLQDLFVNLRIPREDRERVPVVAAGEDIVWVAGVGVARPWAPADGSGREVRIRIVPGPSSVLPAVTRGRSIAASVRPRIRP